MAGYRLTGFSGGTQSPTDAYGFRVPASELPNSKPSVQRFECRANIRRRRIAHGYSNRTSRFDKHLEDFNDEGHNRKGRKRT